jgi:3-oxoacyl-[acyl-carrier protein] reductase
VDGVATWSGAMTVALVTGASKGIGRAIAESLAADGIRVACGYNTDETGAKETVERVLEAGGDASAFRVDVTEEEQVREVFAAVTDWAEAPLVLVNNAGISIDGLALRYDSADLAKTLSVNLVGAFLCARESLRPMVRARWGRIVNVSSVAGLIGNSGQAAYSASKAGVIGMTRSLAREVGHRGVTVNAVCPGLVETDMAGAMPEEARERLVSMTPAGRIGRPEEVAALVRLLVSEEGAYVNGAVIPVDGGLTA